MRRYCTLQCHCYDAVRELSRLFLPLILSIPRGIPVLGKHSERFPVSDILAIAHYNGLENTLEWMRDKNYFLLLRRPGVLVFMLIAKLHVDKAEYFGTMLLD